MPEKERFSPKAVVISNGFGKFLLATAAAEAHRHGMLAYLLTGFYPKGFVGWAVSSSVLGKISRLQRLKARGENLPCARVKSLWVGELLFMVAYHLAKITRKDPEAAPLVRLSHWLYARAARRFIRNDKEATLYHYRSGYGLDSLDSAKKAGMLLLCDHTIAHPALLQDLVENGGKLPEPGKERRVNDFWQSVLRDTERADHILTNSAFARSTFLHQGWDPDRVHVIYYGVDEAFFEAIPPSNAADRLETDGRRVRLAFAGTFSKRKGGKVLIESLARLGDLDWELEIFGNIDGEFISGHRAFFRDPRVKCFGVLSRTELARRLARTDVFVFPSLAEGSARVVFEAMACGCYVITTPNSGSIVEDGVHGRLVPPGDVPALSAAIEEACSRGAALAEIGSGNAELIRRSYRQADLGHRLARLYSHLLQSRDNQQAD